jgi:hypothetical protein
MPTINPNSSQTVRLAAGSRLRFVASGSGAAILGPGPGAGQSFSLGTGDTVIGPFTSDRDIYISAVLALQYTVMSLASDRYNEDGSIEAATDSSGASLTGEEGLTLSLGGSLGLSGVTYDGSNRVVGFALRGITYTVAYTSTTITITGSNGFSRVVTLDGSSRVIGVS